MLGYARGGVAAGRYQSLLSAEGEGAEVFLQQVPDGKHGKNRVHLDLRTRDLESEIRRLASIGAFVLTQQPVIEAGWRWHIPADPDGSGFCVLQPPASHRAYWRRPRHGARRVQRTVARAERQMTAVMTGTRSALGNQPLVLALRPPQDRLSAWFPLWLRL